MIINFFIFLSTLLLFCGLALDAGMLQVRKLQLQHAADAAALGAMMEKSRGFSDWVAAGKADAALNGFTDGVNGVTITVQNPPTSGTYSGNSNAIQATVVQNVHPSFMALVGGGTASPGSTAVAATSSNPDCVYIMNPNASFSYPFAVQSFSSVSSACNIYMDSTGRSMENDFGSSVSVTGGSSIKIQGTSSGTWLWGSTSPSPTYNSSNENDPLSYVTAPTFSSCTYSNMYLLWTTTTLNPGTYCNLTINGSHVTLNPGLYILVGGFNVQGGSTLTGTGVTLYLTKGGSYNFYQNFNISSSTVTLSAPTSTGSGGIMGIVVFADRNWSDSGGQNLILSNSYVSTDGIWYALNVGISNWASTLTGTHYLGVVTDNMTFSSSTFSVPSPDYSSLSGGNPFQGSGTAGLVQ